MPFYQFWLARKISRSCDNDDDHDDDDDGDDDGGDDSDTFNRFPCKADRRYWGMKESCSAICLVQWRFANPDTTHALCLRVRIFIGQRGGVQ